MAQPSTNLPTYQSTNLPLYQPTHLPFPPCLPVSPLTKENEYKMLRQMLLGKIHRAVVTGADVTLYRLDHR
jgi:hypothetical protein